MQPNLPKDWRSVTLRSVCEPTRTWNPLREPRDEFWYVDVSAISRKSLAIETPQRLKASQAPSRARKIIHTGDAIFATVRPTLRRIAFVDRSLDNQIASTAFCVVRANPKQAAPRFLYYALQTDHFNEEVAKHQSGASYPAVNDQHILDQPIPLPPGAEQLKIAAILRNLQRAIALEQKLAATARELKQSAMHLLFTHGIRGEPSRETDSGSLPATWALAPIRSKAKLIAGGTPTRGVEEYWESGNIPWVKTGEVDYCVIQDTEEKITPVGLENSAAKLLPKGTLLIAMYGQGITRGKVALLGLEACTNQACAGIVPTSGDLLTTFLFYYLTYSYDRLRSLSHGAQQQNLNAELVGSFYVPIPSLAEQQEIAQVLQTLDLKYSIHERKHAALSDFFQVLLHQLLTAEIRVDNLEIDTSTVEALTGDAEWSSKG